MGKKGFTLAETLITLMVIGVVAALTIPSLMQTYKIYATETALKKQVATWNIAIKSAIATSGENISDWNIKDISNPDTPVEVSYIKKYLAPHLRISEYVSGKEGTGNKCVANNAKGRQVSTDYCNFCLEDGSCVSFENYGIGSTANKDLGYIGLNIDINGRKGPNKFGSDIFFVQVFPDKDGHGAHVSAAPIGNPNVADTQSNRNNYKNLCYNDSNWGMLGRWCAGVIIGNGYKIPKDYPWIK